jgi:signal peptidase I
VLPEYGGAPIEVPAPRRSLLSEVPALVAAALLIAFLVKTFAAQAFFIPSESMVSTLEVGDRVVVSRMSYRLHDVRRGDVVVFLSPAGHVAEQQNGDRPLPLRLVRDFFETVGLVQPSTEDFIKRVIALPGETVEGRDGRVWVDGSPLAEPYLGDGVVTSDFGPTTVAPDHLWVMGDNRGQSSDSRVFGAIPQGDVVGRAMFRIWPPARIGFL